MIEYMLDTNICIYVIKNRPSEVVSQFNQHYAEMAISSVVASELYYGAYKSGLDRHMIAVQAFVNRIAIIEFDNAAANASGEIRADLANRGTPIGPYDVMIAGHAVSQNCTLVTNNVREFERVSQLAIENWINTR